MRMIDRTVARAAAGVVKACKRCDTFEDCRFSYAILPDQNRDWIAKRDLKAEALSPARGSTSSASG